MGSKGSRHSAHGEDKCKDCKPKPPEPVPTKATGGGKINLSLPRASDGWSLPSRYEVKRSLGKGSYGSVSECIDKEKGISVAVKQLKGLFEDLIDCKRILRELAILTRLDSDRVVRVHDIVIAGPLDSFNELYIVLEICDSDMKKLVRTDTMLTNLHTSTMLHNTLVGLKYIHSAGIYHRDLKPANLLVQANCSVKICDFGLARSVDEGPPEDEQLQVGEDSEQLDGPVVAPTLRKKRAMTAHVVTRWYRAPELILVQRGYNESIDIWSIGCIYAELLQMQDEKVRFNDRGPLFPGGSCYPLSPERRKGQKAKAKAKNDQLEMIFSVIGTPSEEDVNALENEEARKYIRSFDACEGEGIASRYPGVGVGREAMDLLTGLLRFHPKKRLTVEQALEHPSLENLRDKASETTATSRISLRFETQCNARGELSEAQLRRLFGEEQKRFCAA